MFCATGLPEIYEFIVPAGRLRPDISSNHGDTPNYGGKENDVARQVIKDTWSRNKMFCVKANNINRALIATFLNCLSIQERKGFEEYTLALRSQMRFSV